MTVEEFLKRLKGVRKTGTGWQACCPNHEDKKASLSVSVADDKILMHCHAGCDSPAILVKMNLKQKDLFLSPLPQTAKPKIVATYDYTDETGKLLYQSVRFQPKDFRQRHPNGKGGWVWSLKNIRLIPYRLPELLKSKDVVFIPEGEKDVDNMRSLGLTATCNPMGAGKWRPEFSKYLKGHDVIIIPDNDVPGQNHAIDVAKKLDGFAKSVKILEIPGAKDFSDWLNKTNGTKSSFIQILPSAVKPKDYRSQADLETQKGKEVIQETWEKPICFLEKIALPNFPSSCLPDALRGYVEAVAACRQVPVDLPALLALSIAAAAGAKKYRVYIGKSHSEPLNIWTISALPPGSRKTDTFEDMAKPLYIEQKRLTQAMFPVIEEGRTLQKIHEKRMEHLLNQVAREKNIHKREELEEELSEMGQSVLKVPAYPCLIASGDTTPEAAAALLEDQGGKIAILDTEGGLFSVMNGRYDSKGEPNLDVWLKMHAGDELSVHRKNRIPIEVSKPAGTVAITVQPAVIKNLATKKDFKDRGLLGRFLYAIPEDLVGTRIYQNRRVDQALKDSYLKAIERIFHQPEPKPEDEHDRTPHHKLYLKGAALEIWEEFYNDVEIRQARGGDLEGIRDWASKCAGAIARIAGIFHIVETGGNPDQNEISAETMVRAYEIGRIHLIEHAKMAYGLMSMTAESHLARDILSWIAAKEKTTFTVNDFWIDNRSKAKSSDDLLPAFKLLEDRAIIHEIHETSNIGRKPKHKYEVNPSCKACFRCLKSE